MLITSSNENKYKLWQLNYGKKKKFKLLWVLINSISKISDS